MYAQILIDDFVCGRRRVVAYLRQNGKAQQVENETHAAEWRKHEQEERIQEPSRMYLIVEQLHVLRRQQHHRIARIYFAIHYAKLICVSKSKFSRKFRI